MAPELHYLTLVTVFTALLWIPYILNTIKVRGIVDAVGYPAVPKPLALWAQRIKAAHYNSVENLVIFATLVLTAHAANISGPAIAGAACVYFWARIVHAVAYALAIPWVRTLAFAVGVGAQLCIAWHILAHHA